MSSGELQAGRNVKMIIIVVVIVGILGVAAVVTVLTPPQQNAGQTLTILTRHDTSIQSVYEEAFLATDFAKANNIKDIMWKTQDGAFWDQVVKAGGVDVLWGGGPTLFDQMQRDGNLEPLNSTHMLSVLARVPNEIAGADMKRNNTENQTIWVAAAISSFGFTINKAFLSAYGLPTPKNWTDLAQPIWGSLLPTATIAMGDAPRTTSNTRIYEIMTQGMGWNAGWVNLARMAGSARLYTGSVETQAGVENQQVGVGMSIDYYGYSSQVNNPQCQYVLPENQTIVNGDPIAIAKGTSKLALAEGFVDFVLSAEGQAYWFTAGINRMPVLESAFQTATGKLHPDLYAAFNKTVTNHGIDFNDTLSLLTNAAYIFYFEAVFNNAHDKLEATWKALVDAYYKGNITPTQLDMLATKMGTPVNVTVDSTVHQFTIPYATQINDNILNNDVFRYNMQTLWTAAANAQYDAVYAELLSMI